MEDLNINTVAGNLELSPATLDEIKLVAAQWPMGVVFRQADTEPNGLIFQVGEQEAYGIKLQPPDTDERTARALYLNNLALIAAALPLYLQHQHQGIIVPCTYDKEKTDGRFESGLAFFVSPHPASKTANPTKADVLYDAKLGDGAAKMIFDFAGAIAKAGKEANLPMNTIIGIDLRPRLALGRLEMPFLVQGGKVLAIQYPLRKEQPFWAFALHAGFTKLGYAPMIAGAVAGPPNVPHSWLDRVKILSQRLR